MKNSLIILSALVILIFQNVSAQITINGTITDSELNPISNALVEIIDQDDTTNYYSATTDASGYFSISNIFTDLAEQQNIVPSDFIVLRNYPNPFNPSTIIYYELPKSENIEIKIYDILGREVRTLYNNFHKAGTYTLNWDGRNNWNSPVAAGVYFCRLKTNDQFKVHKLVLLDGGSINFQSQSFYHPSNFKYVKKIDSEQFLFNMIISHNTFAISNLNKILCTQDTTLNITLFRKQTKTIGNSGGIIETDGYSLYIPAGALLEDTDITITPILDINMHEWCVAGVHLEPDNLILEMPGMLRLPLPPDWSADHNPFIYVSFDSDPGDYINTGLCADVVNLEGRLLAQTKILHFSYWGAIGNCHKGTLVNLLKRYKQQECDDTTAWRIVEEKYPGTNTNIISNKRPDPNTLQAFLGTFFQNLCGFDKDSSVKDRWNEIMNYIKVEKKQVVVTFKPLNWTQTTKKGFYAGVAHSAVFDWHNEYLKLRNSVSAKDKYLDPIKRKNGENVIWFPSENRDITFQDIDQFRKMRSFETVEKELGSSYPQLFSNFPPLHKRQQPWTAIRFYVSNKSEDENPCKEQLQFKYCDINFVVIEMHDTLEGVWSPGWYTIGSFKDNVFDGVINTEKQGGNSSGTIKVVLDDNQNILSLNVMAYHSDPLGFSSQWGFTAQNIPPTENEPYLMVYSYSGNTVCNYVKSIYAKYSEVNGYELEIRNFKCEDESLLHIKFHNWD